MKYRASLSSVLGLGLLLASASSARADEPVTIPATVHVHVSSPKPVQLEARPAGERGWVTACESPCDRDLPLTGEYRIAYAKDGKSPGEAFRLSATSEAVELKVRPESVPGKVAGGAMVGVGGVVTGLSLLGLVVGIGAAAQPEPTCGDHSSDWCGAGPGLGKAVALVSALGLILGGAVLAGGLAALSEAKPKTTQRPWAGREATWIGPQAAPPKKALVAPLSFSF